MENVNASFKKFNYLINESSGDIFPATEFYLYPLTAEDYADAYRNYSETLYPVMAFIYLTNKCSDDCIGCFAKTIENGDAMLELDVIQKLLHDLSENGTKAIKLAGREPTMSPYLSDCLNLCSELGMKSLVITSGANIDRHVDSLSHSCTHLRLSLNTVSEEIHNKLHRPTHEALVFSQRIKYVRTIIKERRRLGLITGATFLVREHTLSMAAEYADMCKDLGFNYVRYTVIDSQKGNWSDEWISLYYKLLTKENDSFKVVIHDDIPLSETIINSIKIDKHFIDPAIKTRVTIHANGKVNSCHEGWRANWPVKEMATYGNININSFNEIWLGERRKQFLDYIESNYSIENRSNDHSHVCSKNCKYISFNHIQRWIINQVSLHKDSKFESINIEKPWREAMNG